MAFAKTRKIKTRKVRITTEAVARAYFARQTQMNKSDSATKNTSSEVQNLNPQKGSALTLDEVLALEAT